LSAVQSFHEKQRATIDSLGKRLRAFLDEPNEENLHDARTAIRRANASIGVMPKRFRERGRTRKLSRTLERLMRRSAKVRDLDTVRARVSGYPAKGARDQLLRRVEKERRRKLKPTTALAESIRKLSPLYPDPKDVPDEKEMRKRVGRVARKLRSRVDRTLPVVRAEPDNTVVLHSLRKDCKRLRYALELVPAHGDDAELVKTMRLWQDLLGAVRDGDVTIGYLEGLGGSEEVGGILRAERDRRRRDYEKFAATARRGLAKF
jgi:CHAD domain-containing protein